jgi:hypothetical protein
LQTALLFTAEDSTLSLVQCAHFTPFIDKALRQLAIKAKRNGRMLNVVVGLFVPNNSDKLQPHHPFFSITSQTFSSELW